MAAHCELDLFDDPSLSGEWKLSPPPIPVTPCVFTCLVGPLLLLSEVTALLPQFSVTCRFLFLFVRLERMTF